MKKLLAILLLIPTLVFGQIRGEDQCKADEDYWSESKTVCFETDNFDGAQIILFREYSLLRYRQFGLIHFQSEFTPQEVAARLFNYNQQIANLEIRRDALTGRAVEILQEAIDKFIRRRDELNSTEPGSPRDKASKAGPKIAALAQQVQEVADSLDATLP